MVEAEVLVYSVQQYSSRVYTEEEVARNESEPAAATASPLSQKDTEAKTEEATQATVPTSDQHLIKLPPPPPSITAKQNIISKTYSNSDPKKEVASTKLSKPVAVPPTVIETPLTTKPLKETKEPIQTTAATSDEVIKSSPPPSTIAKTMILPKTHLSRDPKKEVASTKLSEPVAVPPTVIETPLTTKPLKETKEPIQTTTATSDQEVIKSSPPPSMTAETMILPKVIPSIYIEEALIPPRLSRLQELNESIPVAATIAETAQARRTSL
ncbi:hypothetical protein GH714_005999 [Hevea brasiliensis]|uniref:Uncharacterized protein n=1 Tax=Hevea brasiliensis TaxID=3981 RepID=A0A6A6LIR4_HEVBR|nr:hypothetical protein GH714_005999 [Hevea brasiliensis]